MRKTVLLRPEQRSVEWIMDLVTKFCKAKELMLDSCACAFATLKAFLKRPKHRKLAGCVKDSACFQCALPLLVGAYTKQVSIAVYNITGSDGVVKVSDEFMKKMAALISKRWGNSWIAPTGLILVQMFPAYNVHFVGNVYKVEALVEKCRRTPF